MEHKIAVLFGGRSSEHTISLQSAYAVLDALTRSRFHAVPVGITQAGRWLWYQGPIEAIPSGAWETGLCVPVSLSPDPAVHGLLTPDGSMRLDAVFPVLHGKNGEDGTVQGLCALAGVPCAGCGVLASAVCMDKDAAHRLAHEAGVNVPFGMTFSQMPADSALRDAAARIGYPLFVKPVRAGSSYGITRVTEPSGLSDAVELAFQYDSRVLMEQAVPGFEVGCAVLGSGAHLTAGEVDEIDLNAADSFFDYTEKYTLNTAQIHMPARLPDCERERIRMAAKTVYQALGCEGFARVDLFYTPDGTIVFNEVNTIPGFTAHSRFPAMMRGVGMGFDALIAGILERTVNVR